MFFGGGRIDCGPVATSWDSGKAVEMRGELAAVARCAVWEAAVLAQEDWRTLVRAERCHSVRAGVVLAFEEGGLLRSDAMGIRRNGLPAAAAEAVCRGWSEFMVLLGSGG